MRRIVLTLTAIIVGSFWVVICAHSELVQVRPINFGTIAIINNTSQQTLNMDRLGNLNVSNGIRIIVPGQPGIYEASGFAGNVELFINAQILNNVMNPGRVSGEYPNLVTLDAPASIRTESDGIAMIYVGGSIQTSASGSVNFVDETYRSTIRITINF